jgi:hypothetical protein
VPAYEKPTPSRQVQADNFAINRKRQRPQKYHPLLQAEVLSPVKLLSRFHSFSRLAEWILIGFYWVATGTVGNATITSLTGSVANYNVAINSILGIGTLSVKTSKPAPIGP